MSKMSCLAIGILCLALIVLVSSGSGFCVYAQPNGDNNEVSKVNNTRIDVNDAINQFNNLRPTFTK
jgi:hypothetical protein